LHWQTIASMLRKRGGLDSLSPGGIARCILGTFDAISVLPSGRSGLGPRATTTPTYPSQYFQELPPGFHSIMVERKLSVQMLELIANTSRLMSDRASANQFDTRARRKYSDFLEACPCLGGKVNLEKLIGLAIMLFCGIDSNSKDRPS
jgi:hypothetical protein